MTFDEVAAQIDDWVAEGAVPGASIAIEHRGELVSKRHAGVARPGVPVSDSTLFGMASLSKPVTAAAFLALCDEGVLDLDATVSEVLPEFGAGVNPLHTNAMLEFERDSITFRQLLAHTSGLPENLNPDVYKPSTLASRDEQIDLMLRTPMESAPGEILRYSNLGAGIAARAAEVVTGLDFPSIVRSRILQPMDLRGIVLDPQDEQIARLAHLQDAANEGTPYETYNSEWWRTTAVPWGGYYGSAEEMLRFTASFQPGQESVLSDAAVNDMTRDQAKGVAGGVESMRTTWDPSYWAVGWEMKGSKPNHWTGDLTSPHTWNHWGFAGTLAWADPARKLSVVVFANRSVTSLWMFRPPRWSRLCDDLCKVADELS